MPDSRFAIYEAHDWRVQQAIARGVRESEDDQSHQQWLRADEAFDTLEDVIGSLESIRGLSPELDSAKALLTDARAQIRGCAGVGGNG